MEREITQETQEQIALTARGRLDEVFAYEDQEPEKGTKDRKEWEKIMLSMYKEYNKFVGFKAFKETKTQFI